MSIGPIYRNVARENSTDIILKKTAKASAVSHVGYFTDSKNGTHFDL